MPGQVHRLSFGNAGGRRRRRQRHVLAQDKVRVGAQDSLEVSVDGRGRWGRAFPLDGLRQRRAALAVKALVWMPD